MTELEAMYRVETGNFGNGFGFDMSLLIDSVGTLGEMFRNGKVSAVVRCKECKRRGRLSCPVAPVRPDDFFCADGERNYLK